MKKLERIANKIEEWMEDEFSRNIFGGTLFLLFIVILGFTMWFFENHSPWHILNVGKDNHLWQRIVSIILLILAIPTVLMGWIGLEILNSDPEDGN